MTRGLACQQRGGLHALQQWCVQAGHGLLQLVLSEELVL